MLARTAGRDGETAGGIAHAQDDGADGSGNGDGRVPCAMAGGEVSSITGNTDTGPERHERSTIAPPR